jgi:uncharacterized protein (TIGR02597 family)
LGAGSQTLRVVYTPTDTNYPAQTNTVSLTVNPAPLTITASNASKTYGTTVTFAGTEFTTSGLVNGDTVASVKLASPGAEATATVAGSPYAISVSGATGTGLDNYTITYGPGTLTVNPLVTTHHLSVSVTPASPAAGSVVAVVAQLMDAGGQAVALAGQVVNWSSTGGGSFSAASSATDASGSATVMFTTSLTPGTVHRVTAASGALTGVSAALVTDGGADSDGDGLANQQELAAGTDPLNPGSGLWITQVAASGADVLVGFTAQAGQAYTLESRDSLAAGSAGWVVRHTLTSLVAEPVTFLDPGAVGVAPNRFYRVRTGTDGEVVSGVAGYCTVGISPGANAVSVPVQPLSVARGVVESVSGGTVALKFGYNWAANAFGPAGGYPQYVLVVCGRTAGSAGDWWTITGNTGNSLTLDTGTDNLESLLASGDVVEIRRLTSLKDLFGSGPSLILNQDGDGSAMSGDSAKADVIRFVTGTAFGTAIFNHKGMLAEGYYQGNTYYGDGSGITVLPGQGFMVFRQPSSTAVGMVVAGQVQSTRLAHYLRAGPNVVGSPFAGAAPVGVSGLRESGWVDDSTGAAVNGDASAADLFRLIQGTAFGTPVFYHKGLQPEGWYEGQTKNNDFPLQPGSAYIFFMKNAGRWRQAVPYSP